MITETAFGRAGMMAVAAVLVAINSNAAVVLTDEATFLAATAPGYYLEDFDIYDDDFGAIPPPVNLSQAGWSYSITAPGPGPDMADFNLFAVYGALSVNNSEHRLHVDFTGNPVTAVGGFFFGTDFVGDFISGAIILKLSDDTTETFTPSGTTSFRGFISTVPITSMEIIAPAVLIGDPLFATMDHFYVGTAVPEPEQYALMGGLGLLGFGAFRRFRKA